MTGLPLELYCHRAPLNLSPPDTANWRQRCSWRWPRTLMQNFPVSRTRGQVVLVTAGQKRTRGGSRDSDVKDWTVIPIGVSPSPLVTITPPEQKCPSTER